MERVDRDERRREDEREAGKAERRDFEAVPGGAPATFHAGDFRRRNAVVPEGLKIYWAWRGGRRWEASEDPRISFAPYRALYKVYVIRAMPMPGRSPVQDGVTPGFIRSMLPALEETVGGSPVLLEEVERKHILRVLSDRNGDKKSAAEALGISLKTLYNKLHAYGWKTGASSQ